MRGLDRRRRAPGVCRAGDRPPQGVWTRWWVKLWIDIVVDDRGTVRADVLGRICDELADLYRAGRSVIVVTSGAIARGMGLDGDPAAPPGDRRSKQRAPSARASSTRSTTTCCASAGIPTAQVLLTFFDVGARTHYLNARQTLRKLLDWRVVPVINENDTTTTDEISFGNNDFLAAQVAILLGADRCC